MADSVLSLRRGTVQVRDGILRKGSERKRLEKVRQVT